MLSLYVGVYGPSTTLLEWSLVDYSETILHVVIKPEEQMQTYVTTLSQ